MYVDIYIYIYIHISVYIYIYICIYTRVKLPAANPANVPVQQRSRKETECGARTLVDMSHQGGGH